MNPDADLHRLTFRHLFVPRGYFEDEFRRCDELCVEMNETEQRIVELCRAGDGHENCSNHAEQEEITRAFDRPAIGGAGEIEAADILPQVRERSVDELGRVERRSRADLFVELEQVQEAIVDLGKERSDLSGESEIIDRTENPEGAKQRLEDMPGQ